MATHMYLNDWGGWFPDNVSANNNPHGKIRPYLENSAYIPWDPHTTSPGYYYHKNIPEVFVCPSAINPFTGKKPVKSKTSAATGMSSVTATTRTRWTSIRSRRTRPTTAR